MPNLRGWSATAPGLAETWEATSDNRQAPRAKKGTYHKQELRGVISEIHRYTQW
jgi:hypothetical protein